MIIVINNAVFIIFNRVRQDDDQQIVHHSQSPNASSLRLYDLTAV